MSGITGSNKNFYLQYCLNCKCDNNKDADPICLHLGKMMDGGKPPKECENKLLKARK